MKLRHSAYISNMYTCYSPYIIIHFGYVNVLHHMQVNQPGYVSLHNRYSWCYGPRRFPYQYGGIYSPDHAIAAFWQYHYLSNTSVTYYKGFRREEKNPLFEEIDDTIYKQTSQECGTFRFEAQWALIVTWEGMRGYGRYHVPWWPDTVRACVCVCVCACVRVCRCTCVHVFLHM